MMKIMFIFVLGLFSWVSSATAQKVGKNCSQPEYINHNQVDLSTMVLSRLKGTVQIDALKDDGKPLVGVCFGLFKEKTKKRVMAGKPKDDGSFEIKNIPDGSYRLVVFETYDMSTAANIPLTIDRKSHEERGLLVHIVYAGLHSGSYAELK